MYKPHILVNYPFKAKMKGQKNMKKTEISVLIGLIISIIISSVTAFAYSCEGVRSEVLRLHILANSDSEDDQNLKLLVRDKILENSKELFNASISVSDAKRKAEENLDKIVKIAESEIKAQGYNYKVKAYICDMFFETRQYDNVTMPSGVYSALRIEIGKAEGKNWWCVLFPALCIPAAQGDKTLSDVFSEDQIDTVSSPKYEAKFAIVEVIEKLKDII